LYYPTHYFFYVSKARKILALFPSFSLLECSRYYFNGLCLFHELDDFGWIKGIMTTGTESIGNGVQFVFNLLFICYDKSYELICG